MKVLLIILAVFLYGMNAEAKVNTNDCCNNGLTYEECVTACGTSECCESKAAGMQSSECCDANFSKDECANKCGTSECCESKSEATKSGVQLMDCCDKIMSKEDCAIKCGTSACCDSGKSSGKTDGDLKCVVSGETIEGDAVTYTYLGKEYSFCCGGCVEGFKNEPIKYIEGLKCPVMGNDAKAKVTSQIDGVSYYFCCPPCIDEFANNFEKYNTPQIETLKYEDATDHKH